MIGSSFLKQMAMLALAISMIFIYVKPNFSKIGETQNQIVSYQDEIAKASLINAKLDNLVQTVNAISADNMKKLMAYLPNEMDSVAVSRDIYNITTLTGLEVKDIKYNTEGAKSSAPIPSEDVIGDIAVKEHSFTLSTLGSYAQLKELLVNLSLNEYPLEVTELKVTSDEFGLLTYDLVIKTYSVN